MGAPLLRQFHWRGPLGMGKERMAFSFSTLLQSSALLIASNFFMTIAWYGHLRGLASKAWYVAALLSWLVALFEYLLQVPANRLGYRGGITLPQLKILQEVITLLVFVPFCWLVMKQPLKWDYLWAGFCLVGAVYFVFRA